MLVKSEQMLPKCQFNTNTNKNRFLLLQNDTYTLFQLLQIFIYMHMFKTIFGKSDILPALAQTLLALPHLTIIEIIQVVLIIFVIF